ncbi:metal-dependent hydrolase [Agromyces sp. MMS24-JH15]|uniref:metal-dependent hydrolase n=1 Tax=Agromyces sp. MMS24-JH15 TaxID=3243765 RepID=UPI003748057D
MLGVNHATSGAAAWIALTGAMPLLTTGAYPLDPIGVLAGATVCAGAALLPDADHHGATISRAVPVLGRLTAEVVETVSGGHRHGAHSLLAAVLVAAGASALGLATLDVDGLGAVAVGAGIGTTALTAFGVKARGFVRSWWAAWALGFALGMCIVVFAPEQFGWFPLAVTLGFLAHLAGDLLTTGGLPGLFWPWVPRPPEFVADLPVVNQVWRPNGFVALPILGDTGSWRERALGAVLALYAAVGTTAELIRWAWPHLHLG